MRIARHDRCALAPPTRSAPPPPPGVRVVVVAQRLPLAGRGATLLRMNTLHRRILPVALLACLGACASTQRASSSRASDPNVALIERQVAFANAGDAAGLTSQVSDDFVWYEVTPDATVTVLEGRDQLRQMLDGYFTAGYDAVSTITPPVRSGVYYATTETTEYTNSGDGSRVRQSAHAVYEIRDGAIVNLWYFPAQAEE